MNDNSIVLLIVAASTVIGALLTIVPLLPGTLLAPIGAALCATVVGWDEFPWWFWAAQLVLGVSYLVIDNIAQAVGVGRAGGSRQAMVGGAIGVFAGPIILGLVFGPFAILLGPPIGAVVGTLVGEERSRRALAAEPATSAERRRLGTVALVAYAASTGVKLMVFAVQVVLLFVLAR